MTCSSRLEISDSSLTTARHPGGTAGGASGKSNRCRYAGRPSRRSLVLVYALPLFFGVFSVFADPDTDISVLATAETADGRLRARLSIPRHTVRLSDTVHVTLRIEHEESIRPEMPSFGTTFSDFNVIHQESGLVEIVNGRVVRRCTLSLVPQRTGSIDLWPIPIRYGEIDGESDDIRVCTVPASRIEVGSLIHPESASLDDILTPRTPLEFVPVFLTNPLLLFGIVVFSLLLVAWILWFFLVKRSPAVAALPVLSNSEIAIERLRQLIASRLHEHDVRRFYMEMTAVVRWYIEQTTRIRAPELTTEEFLREIGSIRQNRILGTENRLRLQEFLEASDLVKFAKAQPTREDILRGYHTACKFVCIESENEAIADVSVTLPD